MMMRSDECVPEPGILWWNGRRITFDEYKVFRDLRIGGMTINQARAKLGLPALETTDG